MTKRGDTPCQASHGKPWGTGRGAALLHASLILLFCCPILGCMTLRFYEMTPEKRDTTIPGWETCPGIDVTARDDTTFYILTVAVTPVGGLSPAALRPDSAVLLDGGRQSLKTTLVKCSPWPFSRLLGSSERPPFRVIYQAPCHCRDRLPREIVCRVYYSIEDRSTGEKSLPMVVYHLQFRTRKELTLGWH